MIIHSMLLLNNLKMYVLCKIRKDDFLVESKATLNPIFFFC